MDRPKKLTLVRVLAPDPMPGGWYSYDLAAEEVERRLGVSWGLAQKTVAGLCSNGTLRTCPYREGHGGPSVSWADLDQWIVVKLERQAKPSPRMSHLRLAVRQAIDALWPNGIDGVSHGDLIKRVSDWLETRGKSVPKRDTILREAGRR
jgi:hypothetical protein